jgi:hypothetical protein
MNLKLQANFAIHMELHEIINRARFSVLYFLKL